MCAIIPTEGPAQPHRGAIRYLHHTGIRRLVFFPQRAPLAPIWPLRAPTFTTPPTRITGRRVFFLFHYVLTRAIFSPFFACGPFFKTMYEQVVKHLLSFSRTASTAQHSTAQHSTAAMQVRADQSAPTQASKQESIHSVCSTTSTAQHSTAVQSARTKPRSKYVPIRVRQRKQADRVVEHYILVARCVLKTNEEIKICPAYKSTYTTAVLTQRCCDPRRICL